MTFLRRHWLPLALLGAVLFLGVRFWAEARRADVLDARVEQAESSANRWRGRAVADSLALIEARARAADADTIYVATVDTFRAVDSVWLALPDTASVETVRAVADTTITVCRNALNACAIARAADARVILGLETVATDLRGEIQSLRAANEALKEQTEPASILPTIGLVVLGGGAGYALDGLQGAALGVGLGLTADIGYRGIRSLLESLP